MKPLMLGLQRGEAVLCRLILSGRLGLRGVVPRGPAGLQGLLSPAFQFLRITASLDSVSYKGAHSYQDFGPQKDIVWY